MGRLFGKKDYVWIKCLVGNKYIIIGPFKDEEDANTDAMDNLRGVVFNTYHLKTKDKGEASKALKDEDIGKGMKSQDRGKGYSIVDDEGQNKIHYV
jgi:hypothetical protein